MARTGDDIDRPRLPLLRLLPVLVLAAGFAAFFALGLHEQIGLERLRAERASLTAWVEAHFAAALAGYVLAYVAAVAFSLPVGAVLTIAGGFLFGTALGAAAAIVGATAGATALFLAARTALGDRLRNRVGTALARFDAGFQANAFNYLLFLRLVPVFPFWLVNIAPAFTGIRLRAYVAATAIGVVPGSVVFASVGNGVGAVFDAGGTPDLGLFLRPEILLPLIGLGLLALAPVAWQRLRGPRP